MGLFQDKRNGTFVDVGANHYRINSTTYYLEEQLGSSRFDFLSIDIELAEPAALAGFDIKKYRPSLVCIEAHKEVRDKVLQYFSENGYRLIEKYKGLDPLNFYFTPGADKTE